MKAVVLLFFLISSAVLPASDKRIAFIELRLNEGAKKSGAEAYFLLGASLAEAGSQARRSTADPRYIELWHQIREEMTKRPGHVAPLVDRVIKEHLALAKVLDEQGVDGRDVSRQAYKLRSALREKTSFLKYLPNEEVIREIGRLFTLPSWTNEQLMRLEGPNFDNTLADGAGFASGIYSDLLVRDERRENVSKLEAFKDLGNGPAWGLWAEDVLAGKEPFQFKFEDQKRFLGGGPVRKSDGSSSRVRGEQGAGRMGNDVDTTASSETGAKAGEIILISILVSFLISGVVWYFIRIGRQKSF